jgi:hypothetical protein
MVHNAYRIELKGDSQRKKRPPGCPSPPQLGGGKEREQKAKARDTQRKAP